MLDIQERQREEMRHRFPEDLQRDDANPHREGSIASSIEEQTAKLPSDLFLWSALGALGCSCFLYTCGKKHESLFVGQWAAPLLLLGIYNKIVKVAGSDRASP